MLSLVALTVLPLIVIVFQLAMGWSGMIGYSVYKLAFIIPPIAYCAAHRISLVQDIWRFRSWRQGILPAFALGILSVLIFWGVYWLFGNRLMNEAVIVVKIAQQFSVTSSTVLLVAPFTIFCNSLLEESFYRGFSFHLLHKRHAIIAWVLPSVIFTVQHLLFIYHWVGVLALIIAASGLLCFSLVLQWMYLRYYTIVPVWIMHALGDIAMMGIAVRMLFF